jgi:hypothetical protein
MPCYRFAYSGHTINTHCQARQKRAFVVSNRSVASGARTGSECALVWLICWGPDRKTGHVNWRGSLSALKANKGGIVAGGWPPFHLGGRMARTRDRAIAERLLKLLKERLRAMGKTR